MTTHDTSSTRSTEKDAAPAPEDPRKPDSPDDITKRSWQYVARKTLREFGNDQCTDLAAALTYYAVLAIAPALLAVISVLGLVGDPQKMVTDVLKIAGDVGVSSVDDTLKPILTQLTEAPASKTRDWNVADVLYGVSMPPGGSSRVVTQRIRDLTFDDATP